MDFSKIRFETKEVIYIVMAVVAYIGQLAHLSNKMDEYRYRTDLRLQGVEFRIAALEPKQASAILPKEPKIEGDK